MLGSLCLMRNRSFTIPENTVSHSYPSKTAYPHPHRDVSSHRRQVHSWQFNHPHVNAVPLPHLPQDSKSTLCQSPHHCKQSWSSQQHPLHKLTQRVTAKKPKPNPNITTPTKPTKNPHQTPLRIYTFWFKSHHYIKLKKKKKKKKKK